MQALIDGDLIAYPCAAAAENEPLEAAIEWADQLTKRILVETVATEYIAFLSGKSNFRHRIYSKYKANRTKPKPKWLEEVRNFLVSQHKFIIVEGIEADDALGIRMSKKEPKEKCCCSFDKDMLQIPGQHYNWKTQSVKFVSSSEAIKTFYCQLITGDGADNIPSYDGKVRGKVPKFMLPDLEAVFLLDDEVQMYDYVLDMYKQDKETLHRNAMLLYIQRKEGDMWVPPSERLSEEKLASLNPI